MSDSPNKFERVMDALAEETLKMSDEEILAEMTPEDHAEASRLKAKMLETVEQFKRKHFLLKRNGQIIGRYATESDAAKGIDAELHFGKALGFRREEYTIEPGEEQ